MWERSRRGGDRLVVRGAGRGGGARPASGGGRDRQGGYRHAVAPRRRVAAPGRDDGETIEVGSLLAVIGEPGERWEPAAAASVPEETAAPVVGSLPEAGAAPPGGLKPCRWYASLPRSWGWACPASRAPVRRGGSQNGTSGRRFRPTYRAGADVRPAPEDRREPGALVAGDSARDHLRSRGLGQPCWRSAHGSASPRWRCC